MYLLCRPVSVDIQGKSDLVYLLCHPVSVACVDRLIILSDIQFSSFPFRIAARGPRKPSMEKSLMSPSNGGGTPSGGRSRSRIGVVHSQPGMNCIKIGLPGKRILSKRKCLLEVLECDRKHFGQSYGPKSLSVAAVMISASR